MIKRILLLFYLLLTCACLLQAQNGFSAHRQVTTDHTQVPSTQSNFPVATYNTFTDMKSTGNGGLVTSTSGFDIIPTSDSGCVTALPFDLDYYAPTTGQFVLHVQIASLSSSADNTYYICYGKSSITTNQSSLATVWSGYSAVNHLNKAGGSSWPDSSPSTNTMSDVFGGMTSGTGNLGLGAVGSGTGGTSISSPTGLPSGSGARTQSIWFKWDGTGPGTSQSFTGWGTFASQQRWQMWFNAVNTLIVDNGNVNQLATIVADTNWHLVTATLPASGNANQILMYYDGASVVCTCSSDTMNTGSTVLQTSQNVGQGSAALTFHGTLDEMRVKNSVETANWITTEYNNQKPSSTFLTFGGALTGSATQIGGFLTGP